MDRPTARMVIYRLAVPRIVVSIYIPFPPARVWDEVAVIENHVLWMADARAIHFVGPTRRGVGAKIEVATRIGPIRTLDVMEFTEWVEPTVMGVSHRGIFTGTGRFTLVPETSGTRFSWTEEIRFPWYLGGPPGAWMARPILTRIWRENLKRLADRFNDP